MENSRLILLIDDIHADLMVGKAALLENVRMAAADSAAATLEMLQWDEPDLILLDVDIQRANDFEAITIWENNPETRDILAIPQNESGYFLWSCW
jgi:CheY-like chemotaxis protein